MGHSQDHSCQDPVLSEPAALAQRLKQMNRHRAELDQDIGRCLTQLLDQSGRQHESYKALVSRVDMEVSRAEAAEKAAADMRASLASIQQQLAAQDNISQELARLQSALNKERQQTAAASQQAKAAQQHADQLQARLVQAEERAAAAEEHVDQLQQEVNMWKDMYHGLGRGGPSVPPPPGGAHSLQLPLPHGPSPDGPPFVGNGQGMMPYPPLPPGMPHMPLPPGIHPSLHPSMWLPHGPPLPAWGPPPGLVHTPLPPAQPAQAPAQAAAAPSDDTPAQAEQHGHGPTDHGPAAAADGGAVAPAGGLAGIHTSSSWGSSNLTSNASHEGVQRSGDTGGAASSDVNNKLSAGGADTARDGGKAAGEKSDGKSEKQKGRFQRNRQRRGGGTGSSDAGSGDVPPSRQQSDQNKAVGGEAGPGKGQAVAGSGAAGTGGGGRGGKPGAGGEAARPPVSAAGQARGGPPPGASRKGQGSQHASGTTMGRQPPRGQPAAGTTAVK